MIPFLKFRSKNKRHIKHKISISHKEIEEEEKHKITYNIAMTTVFNNNSFEEYLEDAGRRAVWLGRELAEEEARVLRNIPAELEEVVEEDVGGVLSALNQAGGAEAVIARGIAGVLVGEEVVVGTGAAIVGGVAVAAVTAICSAFYITLWEFGWGGFAWPDTYWKNEQTIDLKDGDDKKPWLIVDRGGHWPGLGVPVRNPRGLTQRLYQLGVRSGPHEMGRNKRQARGDWLLGSWFCEDYDLQDGGQLDEKAV